MPWGLRRRIYLILLGCAMVVASVVVLILNQDASTEILAATGLVGGLAVILNTLPTNGNGDH